LLDRGDPLRQERSQHGKLIAASAGAGTFDGNEMARVATEALVMTAAEANRRRLTSPPIRKGKNVRIS